MARKRRDSHYCEHGNYVGSWAGPDYMCGYCEDGISLKRLKQERRRTVPTWYVYHGSGRLPVASFKQGMHLIFWANVDPANHWTVQKFVEGKLWASWSEGIEYHGK